MKELHDLEKWLSEQADAEGYAAGVCEREGDKPMELVHASMQNAYIRARIRVRETIASVNLQGMAVG